MKQDISNPKNQEHRIQTYRVYLLQVTRQTEITAKQLLLREQVVWLL
jgi:hypothetical protein